MRWRRRAAAWPSPMRVLICGIPNVGKSTLINTLVGKRAAKAADEAGITRIEQRIVLADGFYLYDTPGMLWPRIIVAKSGYNLAASGAVGRNAFDEEEVALELLDYLKPHLRRPCWRHVTSSRCRGAASVTSSCSKPSAASAARCWPAQASTCRRRPSCVIHDFRAGALGRITLETPAEFARWLAEGKTARCRAPAAQGSAGQRGADPCEEAIDQNAGSQEHGPNCRKPQEGCCETCQTPARRLANPGPARCASHRHSRSNARASEKAG